MATPTETRLQTRIDRREVVQSKWDQLLAEKDGENLSDTDKQQITLYREEVQELDTEIAALDADVEAHKIAMERSKNIRRAMIGATDGVDENGDGIIYRDMATYARDVILTGSGRVSGQIAAQFGDKNELEAARLRLDLLKRTPANTLSSNVGGLTPQQHIAQIFQVIQTARPIVESAQRADLERGVLSYPKVTTRPVVAVQSTQKTEAGNTGMVIDMQTATASTYLGGGDLSWQAINWSTPNALDLWFRLVASDYALKTEQDAATVVSANAFLNNIASTLAATPTFAQFMTAVGAGYAEVYANSGRIANTIYMAPDRFGYMLGLTSDAFSQMVEVGQSGIGPLQVLVSRGLNSGEIIVGDRDGLLVAETPGAPVELRVVEPAIGGVEVGLIGAFEAVVVDNGAFALITTAS
jgi:hypothetical protein